MRYYMKSKFFKFKEDFWVKDGSGRECFFVDKEFFSFGLQFSILANNTVKYKVKERLLNFLPSYEVYDCNDMLVAKVKKKLTFFRDSIHVESNFGDFEMEGDFWHYKYRILNAGREIASIDKEFIAFTDNYYVDINYENHPFVIALVVVIDNIIDKSRNNN